jgi:hypothetical protein
MVCIFSHVWKRCDVVLKLNKLIENKPIHTNFETNIFLTATPQTFREVANATNGILAICY